LDFEGLAQETMFQAYNKIKTIRHPDLFPIWLYRIANRTVSHMTRRLSFREEKNSVQFSLEELRNVSVGMLDSISRQDEQYLDREFLINLSMILQELPAINRDAIIGHINGNNSREDAIKFGVSKTTVNKRRKRGYDLLLKRLVEVYPSMQGTFTRLY